MATVSHVKITATHEPSPDIGASPYWYIEVAYNANFTRQEVVHKTKFHQCFLLKEQDPGPDEKLAGATASTVPISTPSTPRCIAPCTPASQIRSSPRTPTATTLPAWRSSTLWSTSATSLRPVTRSSRDRARFSRCMPHRVTAAGCPARTVRRGRAGIRDATRAQASGVARAAADFASRSGSREAALRRDGRLAYRLACEATATHVRASCVQQRMSAARQPGDARYGK